MLLRMLRTAAAGVLAAGLTGCGLPQVRSEYRSSRQPDDLGWVCAQQHGPPEFTGRMTFEDVQRSLCFVGTFVNRPPNFAALEDAAVLEARRCDGGRALNLLRASPPSRTIRELSDRLRLSATSDGETESCTTEAMLQGIVRSLGADYRFESINDPPPTLPGSMPAPALVADTVVYVRFPWILTGGRKIIEDALRSARQDHTIVGLILDIRGADGAPVDDLVELLSLFIDAGPVLEWRSRVDGTVVRRPSIARAPAEALPVVVLVDEKTQSGAEAFAGALRARGRALVIGRHTAGKATIQSMIDLPSGSHLFIPIADLYETGVGKISGRGVAPDLDIPATCATPDCPDPSQAIALGARLLSAARPRDRAGLLEAARQIGRGH
jgi:peptidase S41-like protein